MMGENLGELRAHAAETVADWPGYEVQLDPRLLLALLDVADAAANTVEALDTVNDEQDWTAPAIDLLLRTALDRLGEVTS